MRTLFTAAFCALALFVASCGDSPTTATTQLGETSLPTFLTNTAWKTWYDVGYDAYPMAENKTNFDVAVSAMKSAFDPAKHKVIMAIKPNCGCQTTQTYMPKIMKALDAAGIPHSSLVIYVTDSRLGGIDKATQDKYSLYVAPKFIVMNGDKVAGSIDCDATRTTPVEQDLASFLSKP